jgi:cytochrome P450
MSDIKIPFYKRGFWPIGCVAEIRKDPILFGKTIALDHPPLVRVGAMGGSVYFTADAQMAHEILVASSNQTNRGTNYRILECLAGHGLFSSDGDYWKMQRKTMQPSMGHGHYEDYIEIFEAIADQFNENWGAKEGQEIRMADEMSIFTIRAIGLSLFSFDLLEKYPNAIKDIFYLLRFINLRYYDWIKLPLWLPLPEFIRFKNTLEKLDAVVHELIQERRGRGESRGDMLDLLLAGENALTGEPLTNKQIRDEVLTIIAAGFKTSSATLSWIWYQLSQHPEVLHKMRMEIKGVIGPEKLSSKNIHLLKYTRNVINEGLRMCPSAFAVSRNFNDDVHSFAGYRVEPGSRVITSIFGIHYNPEYWENPEEFNPDRFEDNEKELRRKGVFLPFGMGSRICLGAEFAMLEMTTVLVKLATKYDPECRKGYHPKMIAAIAIQFNEEMPMRMIKVD